MNLGRILFCLFFFSGNAPLFGQSLSNAQALHLADELHRVEILSEQGWKELKVRIQNNTLPKVYLNPYTMGSLSSPNTQASASRILQFCADSFKEELHYRQGREKVYEFWKQIAPEQDKIGPKEVDKRYKKFMKGLEKSNAFQIEKRIKPEKRRSKCQALLSYRYGNLAPAKHGNIHPNRSVLGKTLLCTARELKETGLIDSLTYVRALDSIQFCSITIELKLLQSLAVTTGKIEQAKVKIQEQAALIQKLDALGFLSSEALPQLNSRLDKLEPLSNLELIRALNRSHTIDLSSLPKHAQKRYRAILKELTAHVPKFQPKNIDFDYAVLESDFLADPWIETEALLSFEMDSLTYYQDLSSYFSTKGMPGDSLSVHSLPVNLNFYGGVNRWLEETGQDLRVFCSFDLPQRAKPQREVTLSFLSKAERDSLLGLGLRFHQTKWNSPIPRQKIERQLEILDSVGIFSHLQATAFQKARAYTLGNSVGSIQDILSRFPAVVFAFDYETANLENPYEILSRELANISKGAFNPTKLRDTFKESLEKNKETCLFSFEFKSKSYQTELDMDGDWIDPRFMDLIEASLRENEIDGRFYFCLNDGQVGGFIFLSERQYRQLKIKLPELFPKF